MHKKFRCGLLMRTKAGKVKKLDLESGGGSRFCDWNDKDMTLNDVHRLLLNIFKLGNLTKINFDNLISQFLFYESKADTELETALYNFQLQPLDANQYETFFEYIQRNGLNCLTTVIYVCTHEGLLFLHISFGLVYFLSFEASKNDATRKNMATNEKQLTMTTSTSSISKQE